MNISHNKLNKNLRAKSQLYKVIRVRNDYFSTFKWHKQYKECLNILMVKCKEIVNYQFSFRSSDQLDNLSDSLQLFEILIAC